jgi:hypothetical protein
MSGTHTGGSHGITGLQQGENYSTNNTFIDWKPKNNLPVGSCIDKSVTLGLAGSSVSASWTACPETSGLSYIRGDVYPIIIRTKWDGDHSGPVNGARDTTGTASVDNPADASDIRGWDWTAWWE